MSHSYSERRIRTICGVEQGAAMSRRNQGPRLRWLAKRGTYYVAWTENGRSRERSTGTADRQQAEIVFAEWLQLRRRRTGPSDPAEVLVTDSTSNSNRRH